MSFPEKQEAKLKTCHEDLQRLVRTVHEEFPLVVVCGHRSEKEQTAALVGGFSKAQYPKSKHNRWPSDAVDLAPYPLDWNNRKRFVDMYHVIMRKAKELGIEIRAGADFNQDGDLTNDPFVDLPHFERVTKSKA